MSAPKFGTLVPNRVFVGGISASTSEAELAQVFSAYGNVKETKIISDRAGVSKGYGFVTFETEEEAKRLQQEVRGRDIARFSIGECYECPFVVNRCASFFSI